MSEIQQMVIAMAFGIAIFMLYDLFFKEGSKGGKVNSMIMLDKPKVVHTIDCTKDIEDLGKVVLCRCWKSKKFPYCDGSHNEHNKKTGDNVGPIIIKKTAKE